MQDSTPWGESGIYRIRCITDDRAYIGSSYDMGHRWTEHRSLLRNDKHHSAYLQRVWNKYGEECFVFEVIEGCPVDDLFLVEQAFIDFENPVFNTALVAGSRLGVKASEETCAKLSAASPWKGKKRSPEYCENLSRKLMGHVVSQETRDKLSASQKASGRQVGNQHRLGIPHTEETKELLRELSTGRKHTSEAKEKIRQARLAYWAEKRDSAAS